MGTSPHIFLPEVLVLTQHLRFKDKGLNFYCEIMDSNHHKSMDDGITSYSIFHNPSFPTTQVLMGVVCQVLGLGSDDSCGYHRYQFVWLP